MKKLVIIGIVAFVAWKMGYLNSLISVKNSDEPAKCCLCEKCTCESGKCLCKPCKDGKCYPCKCPGCKKFVEVKSFDDVVGGPENDGRDVSTELPTSEHLRNKGGSDGAGLCVFTSIDHAARWQNVESLVGFRDFMTQYPGGGYPDKVDAMIKKKTKEQVQYVQFTDGDPAPLYLALRTGRMPCITYGYSPRYGHNIAHMVNLVYLDDKWACILDNNFPGTYEWVEHKEFIRRWNLGGGGWSVILLNPSAPPVPHI